MAQKRFKEPTDLKEKLWECEKKEGGEEGEEEMIPAQRGKRNPCLFQQSNISALF